MSTPRVGSALAALWLAIAPASLCAWLLLLAPASACAQVAGGASAFLPLRGQNCVLFEMRDGRRLKAKPIGILGDSLWLERPVSLLIRQRFRLAMADVAHVYVPHRNARTMALVHGAAGFAGGALLELGLGSRGGGFGDDAKHVLAAAGVNGVAGAGAGALIGILCPTWTLAVPPPSGARGAAIEPFPAWSVSALGGTAAGPSSQVREPTRPVVTIATWQNSGPDFSWGYEYGTLSRETIHSHRAAWSDTLNGSIVYYMPASDHDFEERWVYSTLQFRLRMLRGGVRPTFTLGLGAYGEGLPSRTVVTDSTGARRESHGRFVRTNFGANAGVGLTWGRGPTQPQVEVRYHGLMSEPHAHWFTVQAGVVYQ